MLRCIFLNVNSLISLPKRHFLRNFLTKHKPDILLSADHRLSKVHKVDFNGYVVFRHDRIGRRGGGTAVLVR